MKNVPDIRFKGFDEEWKETSVSNVVKIGTGKSNTQDQSANGIYPFFIRSDNVVKSNKYLFDTEAVITVGDGNIGRVFHYVNGKFDLHQRCYYMTNFKGVIGKYFYYYFSANFFRRVIKMSAKATVDSVRLNMISDMPLLYPCIDEQTNISNFLNSLVKDIDFNTKKIASLKQLKSASLISMFPQQGETVPRVRFKGFDGEWNELKADNVFRQFIEKNRPDLPVLSATQDKGMVTRKALGYDISHDKRNEYSYKHILPGQFVIHLRSFQGGFAHSDIEGIASPAYTVFEFREKNLHDDIFWKYIFSSKSFIKRLETITYGIRDGRSISFDEFKDMKFLIPSVDEQRQIASYFRQLDIQISEQEKRLEKLKQIKAACLDKMFV